MTEVLLASATELAADIRAGRRTSEAIVGAHIDRVEAVNPTLNAVVARRFDAAREEARAADRTAEAARAGGTEHALPPLHGVPCTIKECFALEGMPQTAGLVSREGTISSRDATAVARLRAAGAIPLGVTNLSELCMWYESSNRVYGRTNNPYDPRCIVGGSSGGEGAIVGAGGVPFGLGSDIAGSIRLPAFFNGVFGHKPTGGLVPATGQYPTAEGEALRYLTTGPLARRAEDLWPLLKVLAGPDGHDTGCRALPLGDPAGVDVGRLRILDVPTNGWHGVEADLRQAQAGAVAALAGLGATVERPRFRLLRRSFDIWSAMLGTANPVAFADLLVPGKRFRFLPHLVRWAFRRSPHTLPALALAALERINHLAPGRTRRLVGLGRSLRDQVVDALGEDGVMLFPTYGKVAPRHYRPLWARFRFVYTSIINVMELPSTQIPLGLGRRGLPLGLQAVAAPGKDHLTVAVAMALEQAFGGWVPPPAAPLALPHPARGLAPRADLR